MGAYLRGTKNDGLVIAPRSAELYCSADASFNSEKKTGCGQTGYTVHLGKDNAPFVVFTKAQTVAVLSSTEAEIIASSACATKVRWLREFLNLGLELFQNEPTKIEQDNQSAIMMMNDKRSTGQRVLLAELWVNQHIKSGELELVKVPTERMIADGLTKPLEGERFQVWKRRILNHV